MLLAGRIKHAGAAAVLAVLVACSTELTPVATPRHDVANLEGTGSARVRLCKYGPAGTTATFALTATGGTLLYGNQVTVNAVDDPKDCIEIWETAVKEVEYTVTATEIDATPGTVLSQILVFGGKDGDRELDVSTKSASARVDYYTRASLVFKNIMGEVPPPPPPPPATQGCTPGYWKQSQHFDSWPAAYAPGMSFDAVFADAFPGMTLLDVLKQGGGGIKALGRHTVAALLNAGNGDVQNGLTTAQVISAFDAAFASGDYETQKNIFEGLNELGCPLN